MSVQSRGKCAPNSEPNCAQNIPIELDDLLYQVLDLNAILGVGELVLFYASSTDSEEHRAAEVVIHDAAEKSRKLLDRIERYQMQEAG